MFFLDGAFVFVQRGEDFGWDRQFRQSVHRIQGFQGGGFEFEHVKPPLWGHQL